MQIINQTQNKEKNSIFFFFLFFSSFILPPVVRQQWTVPRRWTAALSCPDAQATGPSAGRLVDLLATSRTPPRAGETCVRAGSEAGRDEVPGRGPTWNTCRCATFPGDAGRERLSCPGTRSSGRSLHSLAHAPGK